MIDNKIEFSILDLDKTDPDKFLDTLNSALKGTKYKMLYGKIPSLLVEDCRLSSVLTMIFEPITISEKDTIYEFQFQDLTILISAKYKRYTAIGNKSKLELIHFNKYYFFEVDDYSIVNFNKRLIPCYIIEDKVELMQKLCKIALCLTFIFQFILLMFKILNRL